MDNREMILKTAKSLFYERGYDGVGVQEIAEKSGVTKPTLYYYFGSKKGLLEQLLVHNFQRLKADMEKASVYEGNLRETLYRTARVFFDAVCADPEFYLLLMSLFFSGRKSEGFRTVYPFLEQYYQFFVNIFDRAAGELGNMRGRQKQFAISFTGCLQFYLLMLSRDKEDLSVLQVGDEEITELLQQFLYGIYT
ncbi:MAG TPA: TetR/AcrR family transcriptional regulator [Candidatus Scatomonas pullistercoris]|uniref:TetR/AcrR family transcriptional regulator n=1 Tax=Candidatus Scatomonas pullistercoris TaxID=2840920 RepID=A0A9D1P4G9_9FIRM|nr:TetR/AcrR family transcriptional regulator [Candidatus Scatomonas pullistercoris]